MKQKKKGFTLIELLAVIVILAIIALIAVPVIMNIINKANKSAFKDTAYGVISAGELYYAEQLLEPNGMQDDVTMTLPDTRLQLKGEVPTGTITITKDGKVSIALHNNRYCVTKGIDDKDVTITEDIANCILPVSITNITLKEENIVLNKGEEKQIEVIFEPSDATNRTLNYVSSNTSVVTVDLNGKIKAVEKGIAKVTVTTTDGSNISKQISITVNKQIDPNSLTALATTSAKVTSIPACLNEGTECDPGTPVAIKVNASEVYNFYIMSETDNEVTLIMDSNLGDEVEWNKSALADSSRGPTTVVAALKERTSTWTNIPEKQYTYSGSGSKGSYNLKETMRARMLIEDEAQTFGCKHYALDGSAKNSCPVWLYENLIDYNDGYWLSTAMTSQQGWAYTINSYGYIYNASITTNFTGVRPIITLSK